jgi:hypothetical protein
MTSTTIHMEMNIEETERNEEVENSSKTSTEFLVEGPKERIPTRVVNYFKTLSLPQLMRGMGALIIITSALAFIQQSWSVANVLTRYYSFLGFSGLLCAAGFFCGVRNDDDRGARTLLTLASAMTPALFAVLGGMLLRHFNPNVSPRFDVFAAPPLPLALLATGIGVLVTGLIAYSSFRVLARSEAKLIALFYMGANALLLLPIRDPNWIAPIGGLAAVGLIAFDRRRLSPSATMRTLEGYFVRAMLIAPVLLVFGRAAYLYEMTALLCSVESACVALILFSLAQRFKEKKMMAIALEWVGFMVSSISIFAGLSFIDSIVRIPGDLMIPLLALPLAALMTVAARFGSVGAAGQRKGAALLATGSMLFYLGIESSLLSAFLCLSVSLVTVVYGFKSEEKIPFAIGVIGVVVALLYHVRIAVEHYALGAWGSLAFVGVAVVLAASFYEKNEKLVQARAVALKSRIQEWDA